MTATSDRTRTGGRGARQRILAAAAKLFYENGIHATGVAALVDAAQVSTRTFYQHFPSKEVLVETYLREFDRDVTHHIERYLSETDDPRDQLLALFTMLAEDPKTPSAHTAERGCPFHNAAVEAADDMVGVSRVVRDYKQGMTDRLIELSTRADATDPDQLGRSLALLIEGATAMSTSLGSTDPLRQAREAARILIDHGIPGPEAAE